MSESQDYKRVLEMILMQTEVVRLAESGNAELADRTRHGAIIVIETLAKTVLDKHTSTGSERP